MKYVGVCFDSGAWGGDLSGLLVARDDDGWGVVTSHISSSPEWSERDILDHFDRRADPSPDDTFEWLGLMEREDMEARFGWLERATP